MADMYDSARKFEAALDRLVSKSMNDASKIIRKALYDVSGDIVDTTPHDTGRARAGWILTADNPSDMVPPKQEHPLYQSIQPSHDKVKHVEHASSWVWWISNNVEYISYLEEGTSKMAPTGMVAKALSAFANYIKDNVDLGGEWE